MKFDFQEQDFRTFIYSSGDTTLEIKCDMEGKRESIILYCGAQRPARYSETNKFWYGPRGQAVQIPEDITAAALQVAAQH